MSKRIKFLRILAEKSQFDIADKAGISQSKYSLIENGRKEANENERRVIAEELGCKPEQIFF